MVYLQLMAFPLLVTGGIVLGRWCGKRQQWWVAVTMAMLIVGMVVLGQRSARLHFVAPMRWVVTADVNPPLMTATVSVLLTTLLVRLPRRSTRRILALAMAVILTAYGLLPALMPLVVRGSLLATPTVINRQGICLQQHSYTCGPAAAVTCLRSLGIPAEEGPLAVAAQCGPAVGTDGWRLATAVEASHSEIMCTYRYVDTVDDLRAPAVADMLVPGIGGHYMAVLAVETDAVVVGDPLGGQDRMPREAFMAQWQHKVVEMRRR